MARNKKQPGFYKAKELYLLSGLIYCGECGHAMQGNSRLCGRNKTRYITYRCGDKDRTNTCKNKEIRKEYIEDFVLSELEKKLLNDKAIPYIVKMLNDHLATSNDGRSDELQRLSARKSEVSKQIDNIVSAISHDFVQDSFKDKMNELDEENQQLEVRMQELSLKASTQVLTEVEIRKLFSVLKTYLAEKNIPECKKFIDSYVDKVVVFNDKVEVTLKLAIDTNTSDDYLELFTSQKKPKKLMRANS